MSTSEFLSTSNCLICSCKYKSELSKCPHLLTKTFAVYCRLLQIQLNESMRWNFQLDTVPLCDFCCSTVNKLSELNDQLQSIQLSIKAILQTTKLNILKSRNSIGPAETEEDTRIEHFRSLVVREFEPEVRVLSGRTIYQRNCKSKNTWVAEQIESISQCGDVPSDSIKQEQKPATENVSNSVTREEENVSLHGSFQGDPEDNDPDWAPDQSDPYDIDDSANKIDMGEGNDHTTKQLGKNSKPDKVEQNRTRRFRDKTMKDGETRIYRGVEIKLIDQGKPTYHCGKCECTKLTLSRVKHHIQCHHFDLSTAYRCKHCNKAFGVKKQMLKHENNHDDFRNYCCETCGARFKIISALKTHQKRLHFDEETKEKLKNFKCQHCNKKFFVNSELMDHIRTHTGEKPFKCGVNECDKMFISAKHLRKHKLIAHSIGIKNMLQCLHCSKSFHGSYRLKRHMKKIHKAEVAQQ